MNGELVGGNVLTLATLGDQHLGQGRGFLAGQEPADDVAAEDIELCGAPHNSIHVEHLVMWSRDLKPKRPLDSGASDST
jgi:hypothetical protein